MAGKKVTISKTLFVCMCIALVYQLISVVVNYAKPKPVAGLYVRANGEWTKVSAPTMPTLNLIDSAVKVADAHEIPLGATLSLGQSYNEVVRTHDGLIHKTAMLNNPVLNGEFGTGIIIKDKNDVLIDSYTWYIFADEVVSKKTSEDCLRSALRNFIYDSDWRGDYCH